MAVSSKDIDFNNDDQMRLKIRAMERALDKIYLGGGKKRIEKPIKQENFQLVNE